MAERVLPCLLFVVLASASISRLGQYLEIGSTEFNSLKLAHEFLSATFAALIASLYIVRRPSIGRRPSLLAKAIGLGGSFIPWVIFAQPQTTSDWRVLAFGTLLMLMGLAFTTYSLATLGRSFSIAPEARKLVTSGPYKWVRNPAYLAEFVTVVGAMLPHLTPVAVVVFAAFIALQLRRITLEEEVLSVTFPEYAEYRRRTPALIPWRLPAP